MRMKRKKTIKEKVFLLVATSIFFIFLFSNAMALGISPGRATFNFEPGVEKIINFTIVNTDNKAMNVSLIIEGEWSEYIDLNQTTLNFNADEYSKTLSYSVKFPSSTSEGIKARIIASELVDNKIKGTGVGVKISVEHQLYIVNAGEEEKEEINITKVFVKHYEKGKSAKVEVEIMNPSAEPMRNVHSTMMVFDKKGLLRSQFNSTYVDIEPGETETVEAYWDTYGFEEGDYGANLVVYYDNKTKEQNLLIYLRSDGIKIDFGKFEFEKKVSTEYIVEHEEIKISLEILALMIVIILFIIIDVIILIRLKKIRKKVKK